MTDIPQSNCFQHDVWLECPACGNHMTFLGPTTHCEQCHGDWLEARYDFDSVLKSWPKDLSSRRFDMWRYRELLPLRNHENRLTMGEGGTPLLPARNLGLMLGTGNVFVKDERQGPTGSFKDRQASLAVSMMREHAVTEAVLASTGNVAISYSAYSALAGIKMWAFLTSLVPSAKMQEVALYGSEVIKVTGTYDQTKRVAADFAQRKNIFIDRGIRSIAAREAMKTLGFEIAEQLPDLVGSAGTPWRAPDWYIQSVSGGMGPVGVWKAFEELLLLGLVDRMPKLACIQAAGCAPMVNSFQQGLEEAEPVENPQTRVITIATGNPGPAYPHLRTIIQNQGGAFEAVTDEETFRAMHVMAKLDGMSMEPAAATAFAGLFKLMGKGVIKRDDIVVVNCSGHTFPVEKHLLGEEWAKTVNVRQGDHAPKEGLLGTLEQMDGHVRSIAILEDDPQAALLLRRILQTQGKYQISEAYDGRSGLDMIRRDPPDIILLDLMMPELDGFQVIEALKTDERTSGIPVIIITARELSSADRDRIRRERSAILQKGSFTDEDLLGEIQKKTC